VTKLFCELLSVIASGKNHVTKFRKFCFWLKVFLQNYFVIISHFCVQKQHLQPPAQLHALAGEHNAHLKFEEVSRTMAKMRADVPEDSSSMVTTKLPYIHLNKHFIVKSLSPDITVDLHSLIFISFTFISGGLEVAVILHGGLEQVILDFVIPEKEIANLSLGNRKYVSYEDGFITFCSKPFSEFLFRLSRGEKIKSMH
jgi:hypothetical protein